MQIQPQGGAALDADPTAATVDPAAGARRPSRRAPVRWHLLGVVLACLLPGVLGVGSLLWRLYQDDRAQTAASTVRTARALSQAVDAELSRAQAFAAAVASSSRLEAGDLPGFHERARVLLKASGIGARAALSDTSGRMVLNTLRPYGESLPPLGNAASQQRVLATGKPSLSGVFTSGLLQQPVLSIDAPAHVRGQLAYVLSLVLDPDDLAQLLRRQNLPASWIASISDPAGVTAARTALPERFVGQRASAELLRHLALTPEGSYESLTREGIPSIIAYSRSPVTGFTVAIAVPQQALQDTWRGELLGTALGMALLFALGAVIAWRQGGRIARSVQGLVDAATALAQGRKLPAPVLHFAEAEHAGQAIQASVQRLADEARATAAANAELRASRATLDAALASMSDAVFISDAQGRFLHFNEAFASVHRFASKAECLSSFDQYPDLIELFMADGSPAPLSMWAIPRALRGEHGVNIEYGLRRKDTGERWIGSYSFAPIRDAEGSIAGAVVVGRDIAEQKQREDELRRHREHLQELVAERTAELAVAKDAAERANRSKSAFLANMSHEIRTPMNAIIGLTHLMARDAREPLQRERLAKVDGAASHLLQVINDILDLSKIEADKLQLEDIEFDRDALLANAFQMVSAAAQAKGLELVLDTDHLPERLRGDPKRLAQALINLLANAVKFTPSGWVRLRGELLTETDERVQLRFEVRDTGIGIPLDKQAQLFNAFEQADASTSRQHGGTGLGLALTRHLATRMGGQVGLDSAPGTGSCFWFTVWLQRAGAVRSVAAPLLTPGLRVLLVDDLPEALEALSDRLHQLGLRVDAHPGGPEALRQVETDLAAGLAPELLLIDGHMAPLDGVATLQALRQRLGAAMPPAVLVTAQDDALVWQRARDARFDAVLVKPVTPSALHDTLVRVLLRRSDGLPTAALSEGEAELALRRSHSGQRVLLAEDNQVNQEVASELLSSVGLVVEVASDGAQATEMALARPYDLVLMDMQMPGTDGLQATRDIRARLGRALPIVAMTANAFAEDHRACLEAGMNDHVGKPVNPAALYATLLRWLPQGPLDAEAPATAAAPAPGLAERLAGVAGLEVAGALGHVRGNEAVLERVLRTFARQYAHGEPTLLQPGPLPAWRDACHSLQSACAAVGAVELAHAVRQFEQALADNGSGDADQPARARQLNDRLCALVAALLQALGPARPA